MPRTASSCHAIRRSSRAVTARGPATSAFHPTRPYAYVVNELDSTVTAYHWNSERGELKPFQIIPTTTPSTYTGDNTGAEIAVAPSGKFVYASNRGHDSIVIFAVDPASGMLAHVGWESVQGRKPRFFCLDPERKPSLRGERRQSHHRRVSGRSRNRQAHADRPDHRDRKPVVHRFCNSVMTNAMLCGLFFCGVASFVVLWQ